MRIGEYHPLDQYRDPRPRNLKRATAAVVAVLALAGCTTEQSQARTTPTSSAAAVAGTRSHPHLTQPTLTVPTTATLNVTAEVCDVIPANTAGSAVDVVDGTTGAELYLAAPVRIASKLTPRNWYGITAINNNEWDYLITATSPANPPGGTAPACPPDL